MNGDNIDDTPNPASESTATEGPHAARARGSRRRKPAPEPTPEPEATVTEATPSAADDGQRGQEVSPLDVARQKLARMEQTNSICYRHRNDFDRIEHELKKFNYSDAELDMILEPKGTKDIPGYSFQQMERQRQYVRRLEARTPQAGNGYADAEGRRGEGEDGHAR